MTGMDDGYAFLLSPLLFKFAGDGFCMSSSFLGGRSLFFLPFDCLVCTAVCWHVRILGKDGVFFKLLGKDRCGPLYAACS